MCDSKTKKVLKEFDSIASACDYLGKYPKGQPNISAVLMVEEKQRISIFGKGLDK